MMLLGPVRKRPEEALRVGSAEGGRLHYLVIFQLYFHKENVILSLKLRLMPKELNSY